MCAFGQIFEVLYLTLLQISQIDPVLVRRTHQQHPKPHISPLFISLHNDVKPVSDNRFDLLSTINLK